MVFNKAFTMLRDSYNAFSADKAPRLGAALAYYSVFSLAPLLLIAVAIAGAVFGHDAALGYVANGLQDYVGRKDALAIQDMVQHARQPSSNIFSTVVGIVMLLMGASGVFQQLKDALNTIWGVKPADLGIWDTVRSTFLSVTAVLGTGFLLMVSLVISTALTAISHYFGTLLPGGEGLWDVVTQVVSFGVFTGLFALMFKFLPDVKVPWRPVLVGAVLTAALFVVGKYALGIYIGRAGVGSPFGAAGTLAVVLIWVYYSAQILFFGAEFTKVYAAHQGHDVTIAEGAQALTHEARQRQGMSHPEVAQPLGVSIEKKDEQQPAFRRQPPRSPF